MLYPPVPPVHDGCMADVELSDCCGASITVAGRTTRFWVCTACGKACDAR